MVITRFAPSPTGELHVGSVRTALYAYLYAKRHKGQFILRIEDTDRERSTQAAVDIIVQGLDWLGIKPDQPPIYQTQRLSRYHEVANELLNAGYAYRCYISKSDLDLMREEQMKRGEKPRYNRHSRDMNLPHTDKPYVIRFKNPLSGQVSFIDEVLGKIIIDNSELDDFILMRSDGLPTYNFAVVVDDADMQISHVIRGNDHLNNTVRQINVYKALGLSIPSFAHIPMIAGEDGKKLSKRHGAVSVLYYKEHGYLPQALINYLVRLGWSYGDQEIFSITELEQNFNLDSVSKSSAIFNIEKLNWLNQHYIKTLPWSELEPHLSVMYDSAKVDISNGPELAKVVAAYRERVTTIVDLVEQTECYFLSTINYDKHVWEKYITSESKPILKFLAEQLAAINDWQSTVLNTCIKQVVSDLKLKFPQLAQPLRVILTGSAQSPGIDVTLALTGQVRTLERINRALAYFD